MRQAFLSLGLGLGILCGSVTTAYAQHGRGGYGGGAMPPRAFAPPPQPVRPSSYHPDQRAPSYSLTGPFSEKAVPSPCLFTMAVRTLSV
jgi:hypothetical protein